MTPKVCPGDRERGCLVNIAPWRDRCQFCTRTIALRRMERMAIPQIVAGEEELGEQRKCIRCHEWWPYTDEFYRAQPPSDRGDRSRVCRGCRDAAAALNRSATLVAAL